MSQGERSVTITTEIGATFRLDRWIDHRGEQFRITDRNGNTVTDVTNPPTPWYQWQQEQVTDLLRKYADRPHLIKVDPVPDTALQGVPREAQGQGQ